MTLDTLARELGAHLFRLKLWAGLSIVWGVALLVRDRAGGFGGMTLGWGAINLLIAVLAARGAPPGDYDGFRRFLAFNLGLNLVWIGIGYAMARSPQAWPQGGGRAMMLQGAVLMALDGYLFARTGR